MEVKMKRTARFLLLGGLSLVLVSCHVFFMTPFPAVLSTADKIVDISKEVKYDPYECEDCFSLHLLNDSYVFLEIQGDQLFIFDLDLDLKEIIEADERFGPLGYYDGANYIVGDAVIDPGTWSITGPSNMPRDGVGYYDGAVGYCLCSYDGWIETWDDTGYTVDSGDFGPGYGDFRVQELGYDPSSYVYLFIGRGYGDGDEETFVLEADVATVTAGITSGDSVDYPFGLPEVKLEKVEARFCYYTREGYVGFREGRFTKFDFSGSVENQIWGARTHRTAIDFDINGDYFYYFDGETMKLYKCRTWW